MAAFEGWRAADRGSGSDIAGDAALRSDNDAIADDGVTDDADLARENDVAAHGARTGETDLGAEQCVFADDGAVADLDEVVDLRPGTDAGLADGGAVDAGVGLDFDVVVENGGAGLEDLVPGAAFMTRAVLAGEAEAVRPDDGAVLQQDIIAEAAVFAYDGVGVGEEAVADLAWGYRTTCGRMTASSPMVTWSEMTAKAPMWALAPILAVEAMAAVGWMPGG